MLHVEQVPMLLPSTTTAKPLTLFVNGVNVGAKTPVLTSRRFPYGFDFLANELDEVRSGGDQSEVGRRLH